MAHWQDKSMKVDGGPTAHLASEMERLRAPLCAAQKLRTDACILKIGGHLTVVEVWKEAVWAPHQHKVVGVDPPLVIVVVGAL